MLPRGNGDSVCMRLVDRQVGSLSMRSTELVGGAATEFLTRVSGPRAKGGKKEQ